MPYLQKIYKIIDENEKNSLIITIEIGKNPTIEIINNGNSNTITVPLSFVKMLFGALKEALGGSL